MPGEAGLDEGDRDILAVDNDPGDQAAIAIGFFDSDGDSLAEDQARGELLGLGAEGFAGFRTVDTAERFLPLQFARGAEVRCDLLARRDDPGPGAADALFKEWVVRAPAAVAQR